MNFEVEYIINQYEIKLKNETFKEIGQELYEKLSNINKQDRIKNKFNNLNKLKGNVFNYKNIKIKLPQQITMSRYDMKTESELMDFVYKLLVIYNIEDKLGYNKEIITKLKEIVEHQKINSLGMLQLVFPHLTTLIEKTIANNQSVFSDRWDVLDEKEYFESLLLRREKL